MVQSKMLLQLTVLEDFIWLRLLFQFSGAYYKITMNIKKTNHHQFKKEWITKYSTVAQTLTLEWTTKYLTLTLTLTQCEGKCDNWLSIPLNRWWLNFSGIYYIDLVGNPFTPFKPGIWARFCRPVTTWELNSTVGSFMQARRSNELFMLPFWQLSEKLWAQHLLIFVMWTNLLRQVR